MRSIFTENDLVCVSELLLTLRFLYGVQCAILGKEPVTYLMLPTLFSFTG